MKPNRIPSHATAAEVACLLDLSPRRVHQIAAEAKIYATGRSGFPFGPLIRAAFDIARRERSGSAERDARALVMTARTREIEVRTAREELQLVPTEEAAAYVQQVIGALVTRLNGLPAQFTRDLNERRRLEAAIDGIRTEVAAIIAEHGPRYRSLPDNPTREDRAP